MVLDTSQWPTPDDYTTALENLEKLAVPEWLKTGKVERDSIDNIRAFSGAGLYTRTYKVQLEPSADSHRDYGWPAVFVLQIMVTHPGIFATATPN